MSVNHSTYLNSLHNSSLLLIQADSQQKKEPPPEDSDLDRKRRETEALLQSIGISPEPPLGTLVDPLIFFSFCNIHALSVHALLLLS